MGGARWRHICRWRAAPVFMGMMAAGCAAIAQTPAPRLVVPQVMDTKLPSTKLSMASGAAWFATGDSQRICLWAADDAHFLKSYHLADALYTAFAVMPGGKQLAVATSSGIDVLDASDLHAERHVKLAGRIVWMQGLRNGDLLLATDAELLRLSAGSDAAQTMAKLGRSSGNWHFVLGDDDATLVAFAAEYGEKTNDVTLYAVGDGAVLWQKTAASEVEYAAVRGRMVATARHDATDKQGFNSVLELIDPEKGTVLELGRKNVRSMAFETHTAAAELLVSAVDGLTLYSAAGKVLQVRPLDESMPRPEVMAGEADGAMVAVMGGAPRLLQAGTLHPRAAVAVAAHKVRLAEILEDGSLALLADGGESLRAGAEVSAASQFGDVPVGIFKTLGGKTGAFAVTANELGDLQVSDLLDADVLFPSVLSGPSAQPVVSADGMLAAQSPTEASAAGALAVKLYRIGWETGTPGAQPLETWTVHGAVKDGDTPRFRLSFAGERYLVAVEEMSGTVHRYSPAAKRELEAVPMPDPRPASAREWDIGLHWLMAMATSADGQRLAVSQQGYGVRVVNLATGAVGAPLGGSDVVAIAALPAGGWVLARADGTVERWSGSGAAEKLGAFSDGVLSLAPIAAKGWVLVGTGDGANHIVDLQSGAERMEWVLTGKTDWLVTTPEGAFDASDGGTTGMRWSFGGGTFAESLPMEAYADDLIVPGLAALALAGATPKVAASVAVKERRTGSLEIEVTRNSVESSSGDVAITLHVPAGVTMRNPRLKRNGVLVQSWPGTFADGKVLKASVALLDGENDFTAYAFNQDDVKSRDAEALVAGSGALRRPGELWIVAVGIDAYASEAFRLHYAAADARLAAWALASQRQAIMDVTQEQMKHLKPEDHGRLLLNYTTDMLPSMGAPHTRLVLNADATRAGILDALRSVAHDARPEDTVVVYFAGHGIAVGSGYYLLPQDLPFHGAPAELHDAPESLLAQSAVSDKDLRDALAAEQASTAVLIVDACQSGALTGDALAQRRGPMNSQGLLQLAYDKGMYVLAASLSTQTAAEQASLEHGVLTYALFDRGLEHDLASPESTLVGGGATTMEEWLKWSVDHLQTGDDALLERRRGIGRDDPAPKTQAHVQQPRLFAPPESLRPVVVALRPTVLDPLAVATEAPPGSVGATKKESAAASAVAAPVVDGVMHAMPFAALRLPPSTAGFVNAGFDLNAERLLGQRDGMLAAISLKDGHSLWTKALPQPPQACALNAAGKLACIGSMGQLMLMASAAPDAAVEQVKTKPMLNTPGGMIRWVDNNTNLLVAHGTTLRVEKTDGTEVASAEVPVISAAAYDAESRRVFVATSFPLSITAYQLPTLAKVESYTISGMVFNVSVARGGRWMAWLDGGHLEGYDTQARVRMMLPQRDTAVGTAFTPDGKLLLVSLDDGTLESLNPASGAVERTVAGGLVGSSVLLQDAAHGLVAGFSSFGSFTMWKEHVPVLTLPGSSYLPFASFSSTGQFELVLEGAGQLRRFTLPEGKIQQRVMLPAEGSFRPLPDRIDMITSHQIFSWNAHTLAVSKPVEVGPGSGHTLSADGTRMLTLVNGDAGMTMQVQDLASGQALLMPKVSDPVAGAEFLPDGKSLVVFSRSSKAEGMVTADTLGVLPLSIIAGGAAKRTMHEPNLPCCSVAFDESGKRMLTYSFMAEYALYDVASNRVVRRVEGSNLPAVQAFEPGGTHVVIGQQDGTVMWWDTASAAAPLTLPALESGIVSVAFRPAAAGKAKGFVATASDGTMAWFSVEAKPALQAITRWNEQAKVWVTVSSDGGVEVSGGDGILPAVSAPYHAAPGLVERLVSGTAMAH